MAELDGIPTANDFLIRQESRICPYFEKQVTYEITFFKRTNSVWYCECLDRCRQCPKLCPEAWEIPREDYDKK